MSASPSSELAWLVRRSDAASASSVRATPPRARPSHAAGRQHVIVAKARAMLAEAPGRPHRLRDVARAVGVSPSHLSHVFHAEVGLPLHRYLLQLRMAQAVERLRRGDRDLSRLALDLGFATHSHFSAAFRRTFGVSPSAARRALASEAAHELRVCADVQRAG